MRRDMDLIRELLLKLEALPTVSGKIFHINGHSDEVQVDGYNDEQILYHLQLIEDAGLIQTAAKDFGNCIFFDRLTVAGHDFADSVRDAEVWAKTKKGALAAGGFTVELLKDLAKGFLKKQLEERTGVTL